MTDVTALAESGPLAASSPLLAADMGDLVKWAVFLLIVLVGALKNRTEKRNAAAQRAADAEELDDAQAITRSEATPSTDRVERPSPQATAVRDAMRASERPTSQPPHKPARRRGLIDDAHVDLRPSLPTADDMPGAHSAHDHVHLTEIGADRGTSGKHPGAEPTAAATVSHDRRRVAVSGKDLLRSNDLRGKQRLQAGVLWAEVFGPPRSRTIGRARR